MTKLYDLPFEQRIRQKYLIFGIALGMLIVSISLFISGLAQIVMKTLDIIPDNYQTTLGYDITMVMGFGLSLIMLIPFLHFAWYSKSKPKKHPHLNETIGLKDDWDKVKRL